MKSYSLHMIIIIIQLELHWSQPFVLNVGHILKCAPNEPKVAVLRVKIPKSA